MKPEEVFIIASTLAAIPTTSNPHHKTSTWKNPTKKNKEVSRKQSKQSKKSRKINRKR